MKYRSMVGLLVALGTGAVPAIAGPAALAAQKKERNRISREELLSAAQRHQDLYSAIRSLRPHFLSPLSTRTADSPSSGQQKPIVFIGENRAGDLESLRSVTTRDVEEVSLLSPSEAGILYGAEAGGGVIRVKLHKYSEPDTQGGTA